MPRRLSKSGTGSRRANLKGGGPAMSVAQSASGTSSGTVTESEVNSIDIASLTLDVPLRPFAPKKRVPRTPFHFLSLPSELRLKIYAYYFEEKDTIYDLGPDVYRRIHKKLGLMRVCRQVHDEATYYFYSTRTFRLFPTHPGRYFKSKKPILARLKPIQRQCITSLELRLGPGWNAPPKGWAVTPAMGLSECTDVRRLSVFVEIDPSDKAIEGFRLSDGFYEGFSRNLLASVLDEMPGVTIVEFDGWSSVKKSGAMMQGLMSVVTEYNREIAWGPERGWVDEDGEETSASALSYSEKLRLLAYTLQNPQLESI